jgi:hypothetical protein
VSAPGFSDDPADQANRFAIVMIALVVIFVALLVTLLAWGDASSSIERLSDLAGYLRDHDNREAKVVLTLGAGVIALLMLTVIIIEVTPSPLQKMRLRTVKAGDASITTTEIARRIEEAARGVEHVRACAATVATHGRGVDVVLDLHVDPGADLAGTADAACARVQAVCEQEIGVAVARRPRARMHYRELRLREDALPDSMRAGVAAGEAWPTAETTQSEGGPDGRAGDTDTR